MHTITRIETVDESGYIHLQLEQATGVKVGIIIEDLDTRPNQATMPAESLALATDWFRQICSRIGCGGCLE